MKKVSKQYVNELLVQIHRGFLSKKDSDSLSDSQVLANIPESGLTKKYLPTGEQIIVNKPFTKRWVSIRVKKNPNVTAYDLLKEAGFKE